MTDKDDDRPGSFVAYARFCVDLAAQTPDRKARLILREMAADWLRLAEDADSGTRMDGPSQHDGHRPASSPNHRD